MREVVNYYQLLGLPPTASPKQIKLAYHRAAKAVHPDTGGSPAAMELVNEAYQVLSDPDKRREYDRSLREPAAPPVASAHQAAPVHPAGSREATARAEAARDYRLHHQIRLAQARRSAWQLLKNSLGLAIMLGIITRFFATQASSQPAKLALSLIGFVPVYGALLGLVFLLEPNLRLTLHDLPYHRGRQLKHGLALAAALAGAFIPLAVLWVLFAQAWPKP